MFLHTFMVTELRLTIAMLRGIIIASGLFSTGDNGVDTLFTKIHGRVLRHIKETTEQGTTAARP